MKLIAWLYVHLWLRMWIRLEPDTESEPEAFPKMRSCWCPEKLQPYVFAELARAVESEGRK